MDMGRIEGFAGQVTGAVREATGRVLGDAKLASRGSPDNAVDKSRNAAGGIRDSLRGK